MKKNLGKLFEQRWKKSCPDYVLAYKLPDTPQAFGSNTFRFTNKNPFDYLMWDSERHILMALELKSVGGNSISFERDKEDNGLIHLHQINSLLKWSAYDGIVCGFLIEFRKNEKTVFVEINDFKKLIDTIEKKSINYGDFEKYGVRHIEIPQKLARVNYTYDVELFLKLVKSQMEGDSV